MKNDKINYLKILYQRRSTKMFSSKIVPDNKINLIVEAGNESPSSFVYSRENLLLFLIKISILKIYLQFLEINQLIETLHTLF